MLIAFEMTIARDVVMEYWQSYPQMGTNSTVAAQSTRGVSEKAGVKIGDLLLVTGRTSAKEVGDVKTAGPPGGRTNVRPIYRIWS